jgi:hypothetical protein
MIPLPALSLVVLLMGCAATTQPNSARSIGRITDKHLNEASGLIASRVESDVLWTHNDGSDAVLFAIRRDGTVVARVKVNAKIHDWEDVTLDDRNRLYIADTGNNDKHRKHVAVYRVPEPDPSKVGSVTPDRTYRLTFPGKPFNGESLFLVKDTGYLIAKRDEGDPADLWSFSLSASGDEQELKHVLTIPGIDHPITAAALNADGSLLAVLTRDGVYFFNINGEIGGLSKLKPTFVSIPPLKNEGCCFVSDRELLTIAESGEIYSVPTPQPH